MTFWRNYYHNVAAIHPQLGILRVIHDLKYSSTSYINEAIHSTHLTFEWSRITLAVGPYEKGS